LPTEFVERAVFAHTVRIPTAQPIPRRIVRERGREPTSIDAGQRVTQTVRTLLNGVPEQVAAAGFENIAGCVVLIATQGEHERTPSGALDM